MKRRYFTAISYGVLVLMFASHGLTRIFAPASAFALAPLLPSGNEASALLIQWMGLAELMLAMFCFLCLYHAKRRRLIHWILTFFVTATALLQLSHWLTQDGLPSSMPEMAAFVALAGLPALLLWVIAVLPARVALVAGPREQGKVKWFNASKGFGFITRTQGDDIFVHFRSIRGEGNRTLKEGRRVSYVVVKGEKGLQADDVELL